MKKSKRFINSESLWDSGKGKFVTSRARWFPNHLGDGESLYLVENSNRGDMLGAYWKVSSNKFKWCVTDDKDPWVISEAGVVGSSRLAKKKIESYYPDIVEK